MTEYLKEIRKRSLRIIIVSLLVFSGFWTYSDDIIFYILSYSKYSVMTISPIETIQTQLVVSTVTTVI